MSDPIDLDAIEARADQRTAGWLPWHLDAHVGDLSADVAALVAEVRRLHEQRDAALAKLAAVERVVASAQHPALRQETLADDVDLIWRGRTQAREACEAIAAERDAARAELLDARRRAEEAEAKVKRLHGARLVIAVFGVPEEAPQPFALIGDDDKPFALGVQWPGGAVTVKSTPPERLGNTTSPSLEDFFTQYGRSDVMWLSEDLGSLADMEERAEQVEQALARVRYYSELLRRTAAHRPEIIAVDVYWTLRNLIDGGEQP